MLLLFVASAQIVHAQSDTRRPHAGPVQEGATPTLLAVPTVTVPNPPTVVVPTLIVPPTARPKPTPTPTPKPTPGPGDLKGEWIWGYLTSYCPGSAGWISASGLPVYYGMVANNFYPFGTKVYIPVIKLTGVVEDRGGMTMWNWFDVWSPTCYGTPTGWFKVKVLKKR